MTIAHNAYQETSAGRRLKRSLLRRQKHYETKTNISILDRRSQQSKDDQKTKSKGGQDA